MGLVAYNKKDSILLTVIFTLNRDCFRK